MIVREGWNYVMSLGKRSEQSRLENEWTYVRSVLIAKWRWLYFETTHVD
jgi:hypothetical protein